MDIAYNNIYFFLIFDNSNTYFIMDNYQVNSHLIGLKTPITFGIKLLTTSSVTPRALSTWK